MSRAHAACAPPQSTRSSMALPVHVVAQAPVQSVAERGEWRQGSQEQPHLLAAIAARAPVGSPSDAAEREADAVAERAMAPTYRETGRGETRPLAALSTSPSLGLSSGLPLPQTARSFFEPRLGRDLGPVRVHDNPAAHFAAQSLGARAFAHARDIYFARDEFVPGTDRGRRLIAHELAHVLQPDGHTIRRTCSSAATCAAPIVGDPEEFSISEEAVEATPRSRRQRMSATRARSTGHAGRARQLEIILNAHDPALFARIHGIFIDADLSSGTGAMKTDCASWRATSLPASDPDPHNMAAATKGCVFVHGNTNREALRFNQGDAVIAGQPRSQWHTDTIVLLTHEVQHEIFDTVVFPAVARPGGVTTPTCTKAAVGHNLSEIASIVSEFRPRFAEANAEANPAGPAHQRLNHYFINAVTNPSESVTGALTAMGCHCDCPEVDLFTEAAINAAAASFTAAEKTALRTGLQARLPGPARPLWPNTPV